MKQWKVEVMYSRIKQNMLKNKKDRNISRPGLVSISNQLESEFYSRTDVLKHSQNNTFTILE